MHTTNKLIAILRRAGFEAWVWIIGLTYLALLDPAGGNHLSFCGFRLIGFDSCLGCGLGLSISCALHGEFAQSIQTHVLGLPALLILLARIFTLFRISYLKAKLKPTGETP